VLSSIWHLCFSCITFILLSLNIPNVSDLKFGSNSFTNQNRDQIQIDYNPQNTATLFLLFSPLLRLLLLLQNTVTIMGFSSFLGRVLFASLFILSAWQMWVLSLFLDPFVMFKLFNVCPLNFHFFHLGFHSDLYFHIAIV